MAVTGSEWEKITLGTMIPALDPDDENSLIGRAVSNITDISEDVVDNVQKVADISASVSRTLNTVGQLGDQIQELQNEIDRLIGNAVNTGVYGHLLGFNPIFGTTQPRQLISEIQQITTDFSDPNLPDFRGDTASVGGMLLLFSAPSAAELIAAARQLGAVFPIFKEALVGLEDDQNTSILREAQNFALLSQDLTQNLFTKISEVESSIRGYQGPVFTTAPLSELFPERQEGTGISGDLFGTGVGQFEDAAPGLNKWFALRLSEFVPILNPEIDDSPAQAIVESERALVRGAGSLLQQARGLAAGVDQLTNAINTTNRRLQQLSTAVTDTITAVGNTGLFIHMLGLDGSLSNTSELSSAAGRALVDTTDDNRPRAAGGAQAFAGLLLVWGAANPAGLQRQFDNIGEVFGGLKLDIKDIQERASDF